MNRQPHLTASATLLALGSLALGGLAACADVTAAPAARSMTLSFATAPAGTAGISAALAGAADPLVITKAQLVISKTELEMVSGNCGSNDDESDDDGCAELKLGPMLVDLPLTTGAKTAQRGADAPSRGTLPSGSEYRRLSVRRRDSGRPGRRSRSIPGLHGANSARHVGQSPA